MSDVARSGIDIVEQVVIKGDLNKLTPEERVQYYRATCESLGLNPLTKPFEYITLDGRLTLYARKDCTDQLRKSQRVSITRLERERLEGLYIVTASAQDADGRQDSAIGAVNIEGLKGNALANAIMKAETKAKRRVTLSICGLGWSDETELETIPAPAVQPISVDMATGEIQGQHKTLSQKKAQPEPEPEPKAERPGQPEQVKLWLVHKANRLKAAGVGANKGQYGACVGALESLFPSNDVLVRQQCRYILLEYVFGVTSSKDLAESQVVALLNWSQDNLDGVYTPNEHAVIEAKRIVNAATEAKGQTAIDWPEGTFKDDQVAEVVEALEETELEGVEEMPF